MRWLLILMVAVLVACEPAPAPQTGASPTAPAAAGQPQLPAAEPTEPSLEAFRQRAVQVCAQAREAIAAVPLRGDPLRPDAGPGDVSAAVAHYSAVANAWSRGANELYEFGLPADPIGGSFVTALDVLALRADEAAAALEAGEAPVAQGSVAVTEDARRTADQIGRDLGIGPLDDCGSRSRRAGARRVDVTAEDFVFSVGPLQRGRTRFVLRNEGQEEHHLFVVRLRRPGTLLDAVRADRAGKPPGAFLSDDGSVTATISPGGRSTVDVRLRRGAYGLLCFVASPDGTPHAYKGMAAEVVVP